MALANAGLGAVHGFAAPIGGRFPAPHGAVCAALLPHVLRTNLAALRARAPDSPVIARMDEVGRLLTGDAAARADDGIAWCTRTARELHIPTLATWGVAPGHFDEIAASAAVASSMKANPIALTPGELANILQAAL
jgi:alcohol dehydrogenase class IV